MWSPPTSTPHTGVLPQHVSPAYSGPLLYLIAFPCRAFTVDLLQIVQYTVYHNFLGLCYILTSQLQLPSITMEITHKRGASGNGEKKTGQRLSNTEAFINCLHEREKRTSIILRSELRFVGCCVAHTAAHSYMQPACMSQGEHYCFGSSEKKAILKVSLGKKTPKNSTTVLKINREFHVVSWESCFACGNYKHSEPQSKMMCHWRILPVLNITEYNVNLRRRHSAYGNRLQQKLQRLQLPFLKLRSTHQSE